MSEGIFHSRISSSKSLISLRRGRIWDLDNLDFMCSKAKNDRIPWLEENNSWRGYLRLGKI